jgi:hypothetical protein
MSAVETCLTRRLAAEAAYQDAIRSLAPAQTLMAATQAVLLSPDLPKYRTVFAKALARFGAKEAIQSDLLRALQRGGVLRSLEIVLQAGGRGGMIAEPFASKFVLCVEALERALLHSGMAMPEAIDSALSRSALHRGFGAAILTSLLNGVVIRDPVLLSGLEAVRINVARAALCETPPEVSPRAREFIHALSVQVWIQDGLLAAEPDQELAASLADGSRRGSLVPLARGLFPIAAPSVLGSLTQT